MDPVNNAVIDPLTSPMPHNQNPMDKLFAPKQPVQLDKPKDALITKEELAAADGSDPEKPIYVAIKGVVFDVSRNKAYQPGGSYSGTHNPTSSEQTPSVVESLATPSQVDSGPPMAHS